VSAEVDSAPVDGGELLRRIIETQRDMVASDLDLQRVMNLICERTQELTGADSGSILMLEDDALVHRAATGFMSRFVGEQVDLETTFSGSVYRNNRSAICADTQAIGTKAQTATRLHRVTPPGISSACCMGQVALAMGRPRHTRAPGGKG